MPGQTSGRSHQVSEYILMFASYQSDHIVASVLLFVIRMTTSPGLFERPIIFGHAFGSNC